jgi:hypothetical protein
VPTSIAATESPRMARLLFNYIPGDPGRRQR